MPLNPEQEKKLVALDRAVARALEALPSTTSDTDQAAAHQVLRGIDAQLRDHLTDIRNRG